MAAPARLSASEYFAVDESSDLRHELHEGQIVAMSGGSPNHARLQTRLAGLLFGKLPLGCDTYGSDLRVAVQVDTYFYPDLSVICGSVQVLPDAPPTAVNPLVIFEVLSPSTEQYDRGRKAKLYTRIASLRTLVLVEQDEPSVDVYERREDGSWTWHSFEGLDAEVPLASLGAALPLSDLYAGIELEPRLR